MLTYTNKYDPQTLPVQQGDIRRRTLKHDIQKHVDIFTSSSAYLKQYQGPNPVWSNRIGTTLASCGRRVKLALMRTAKDPEALAEKQVRIGQQSKKGL